MSSTVARRCRRPISMAAAAEHLESFRQSLAGKVILAPLTRGGNLPFRRLCADFGAEVTMSEMAYARYLTQRRPSFKVTIY
jgi:tRNA-dihydrouridine synthase